MIRAAFGEKYELHGCDFPDEGSFPAFHGFANFAYQKLTAPDQLPYPKNYFTVVIGSGVLEHTAMDYEALKAVYRVLTDDGIFIISFLPNKLSYVEFLARNLGRPCHRRLYGVGEIRAMLKHHGFEPLLYRFHQFTPAHSFRRVFDMVPWIDALGERVWPLNQFCSTIMIVARKVLVM
jgi:SAM-dependent methyltransferase